MFVHPSIHPPIKKKKTKIMVRHTMLPNGKSIHIDFIIFIIKTSVLLRLSYRFNIVPTKISVVFLGNLEEMILKFL